MSSCPEREGRVACAIAVVIAAAAGLAGAWPAGAQTVGKAGPAAKATATATVTTAATAASAYVGIGRPATPRELAAWDIDVRPDFKGLPPGSGTVRQGMDVWEARCASCHGIFGESNEVFSPIVGGTTAKDIERGHVARLTDRGFPGRTTLMKVPTLSTLWDYINRAMPWNAPKSLSHDEVYAVTAYILNMGGILPDDATLSRANVAEVQKRLPNRDGMKTDHAMWPGDGRMRPPDAQGSRCMKDCAVDTTVASQVPDFARNAHGNLALQNRLVGAQVGADTTQPEAASWAARRLATTVAASASGAAGATTGVAPSSTAATASAANPHAAALQSIQQLGCSGCHGMDKAIVGPGFREVAKKYAGRGDAVAYLGDKIVAGGSGTWGPIPMPPQTLNTEQARQIALWLAEGAKTP